MMECVVLWLGELVHLLRHQHSVLQYVALLGELVHLLRHQHIFYLRHQHIF